MLCVACNTSSNLVSRTDNAINTATANTTEQARKILLGEWEVKKCVAFPLVSEYNENNVKQFIGFRIKFSENVEKLSGKKFDLMLTQDELQLKAVDIILKLSEL